MDPTAQQRNRRGKRLFWSLVGLIVLAPIGYFLYATFGANPPIVISPATTYITAPLDEDGLPDYAAALLADLRKGVTPENNGAVPFMQAMWPAEDDPYDKISAADGRLLCQELGLKAPPPPSRRIGSLNNPQTRLEVVRFIRRRNLFAGREVPDGFGGTSVEPPLSDIDAEAIQDDRVEYLIWDCIPMMRPWTSDDLPFLANWFEDRHEAFDLVVEGASKGEWYLPELSWLRGERGPLLAEWLSVMLVREAVRHLQTRSFLHAGEGRADEAFRDGLAILHLADHLSHGPMVTDRVIGRATTNVGFHHFNHLIATDDVPGEIYRKALEELDALQAAVRPLNGVANAERYFALDRVLTASQQGIAEPPEPQEVDHFPYERVPGPTEKLRTVISDLSIDWNEVLVQINRRYDRLELIARTSGRNELNALLTTFDAVRSARDQSFTEAVDRLGSYTTRAERSQLVADAFLSETEPSYGQYVYFDRLAAISRDLARLHLALAIYRAERGGYPETLDPLVPDILPGLPTDPFNAKPYAYRTTAEGFLLYSFGPTGTDDGGSYDQGVHSQAKFEGVEIDASKDPTTGELTAYDPADQGLLDKIPTGADDISLRVPLPVEPWPWEE